MKVLKHPFIAGMKCIVSPIEDIREPNASDMAAFAKFKAHIPNYVDESIKPILVFNAWLSRETPDRIDDVVVADGWLEDLPEFMLNPAMLINHSWTMGLQPGIWPNLEVVSGEGLRGTGAVYGTADGTDVALLVRAGVYRSISVGFNPIEFEKIEGSEGYRFTRQALVEASLVSSPMHLGATVEEVLDDAEQNRGIDTKALQLKSINKTRPGRGRKGVSVMDPEEVKRLAKVEAEKAAATTTETVKEQGSTVKELGNKLDGLSRVISEMKQAAEGGNKTSGQLRELVDKTVGDFAKAYAEMQEAIKEIRSRHLVHPVSAITGQSIGKMMLREPAEMKQNICDDATVSKIMALQRKNDAVKLVDDLMCCGSRNGGGDYHLEKDRTKRIKGLHVWQDFNEFRKAMDSTTAGEGDEYVPTALSGSLAERVRLALLVAPLFDEIQMPTNPFNIGIDLGDTEATLAGETIAKVSSIASDEQTPETDDLTLTAKKAKSSIQVSTELTEDAAFAILPLVQNRAVNGIARVIDKAIVNGQLTSAIDTGDAPAATDFRKAWNGLRWHWIVTINSSTLGSVNGIDMSTFNETNLRKVRGEMGKDALYPTDAVWLMSIKGYLLRILNDLDQVQTLDKYGPNAVILTGELAKFDGQPLVVTEFMSDAQDNAGVVSGASDTRTSMLLVRRSQWLRGIKRATESAVDRDLDNDVYRVFAYQRVAFSPIATPSSTDQIVNGGYNIDASS